MTTLKGRVFTFRHALKLVKTESSGQGLIPAMSEPLCSSLIYDGSLACPSTPPLDSVFEFKVEPPHCQQVARSLEDSQGFMEWLPT